MELRYTARDGGDALRDRCLTEMTAATSHEPHARLFSARTDFADAWNAFLYPLGNTPGQTLTLDIDRNRFGFRAQQGTIAISEIHVVLMMSVEGARILGRNGVLVEVRDPAGHLVPPDPDDNVGRLLLSRGADPRTGDLPGGYVRPASPVRVAPTSPAGSRPWKVTLPQDVMASLPAALRTVAIAGQVSRVRPEMVEDLLVFVVYQ
jgi:hypothetical protein